MVPMPSEELRTSVEMPVALIILNFKCQNCLTYSLGPLQGISKACGDSQDLKSPGKIIIFA